MLQKRRAWWFIICSSLWFASVRLAGGPLPPSETDFEGLREGDGVPRCRRIGNGDLGFLRLSPLAAAFRRLAPLGCEGRGSESSIMKDGLPTQESRRMRTEKADDPHWSAFCGEKSEPRHLGSYDWKGSGPLGQRALPFRQRDAIPYYSQLVGNTKIP